MEKKVFVLLGALFCLVALEGVLNASYGGGWRYHQRPGRQAAAPRQRGGGWHGHARREQGQPVVVSRGSRVEQQGPYQVQPRLAASPSRPAPVRYAPTPAPQRPRCVGGRCRPPVSASPVAATAALAARRKQSQEEAQKLLNQVNNSLNIIQDMVGRSVQQGAPFNERLFSELQKSIMASLELLKRFLGQGIRRP